MKIIHSTLSKKIKIKDEINSIKIIFEKITNKTQKN